MAKSKRRQPPPKAPVKKKHLAAVAIVAILFIALIWGAFFLLRSSNTSAEPSREETVVTETRVEWGATGKTLEEDKEDAVAAVVELLNTFGESDQEPIDRLIALEGQDFSVVSDEAVALVRFPSTAPNGLKVSTYESLITLHTVLSAPYENGEIPLPENPPYDRVYMDSQLGVAFVPVGVITGQDAIFSFEMVHVEGVWQLAPYSLVEQVKISALMAEPQQPAPSE